MQRVKQEKIKPYAVLYGMRRSVSEILGKPFTERIDHQVFKPDQKVLAIWAADCAERVLPYFEDKYPDDDRPRKAIEALRVWIRGEISVGEAHFKKSRTAAFAANAAARGKKEDDAKYAAYAAGQAAATAHVPTHALASSIYAIRAVAAHSGNVHDGLIKERNWQLEHLRRIAGKV